MVQYGLVWFGMVWVGLTRFDKVCFNIDFYILISSYSLILTTWVPTYGQTYIGTC